MSLVFLLSLASCSNKGSGSQSDNGSQKQTKFSLTDDYVIVYPKAMSSDSATQEAVEYLNNAVKAAYGFTLAVNDDSASVGKKPEILVGATNRSQSRKLSNGLDSESYAYVIESEKVIAVVEGSSVSIAEATKRFCSSVLGYFGEDTVYEKAPVLLVGTRVSRRYLEKLTINGAPVSEWIIAVKSGSQSSRLVANDLSAFFAQYTGEKIEVITQKKVSGDEKNVIALGLNGREMNIPYFKGSCYISKRDAIGSVITLISSEREGLRALTETLIENLEESIDGRSIELTVPEADDVRFAVEDYSNVPAWHLNKETKEELYDGVTYIEQIYRDDLGLPYRTYALILDPYKVSFRMGSANDGFASAVAAGDCQNVMEHMQSAVKNGKNIIAGVNANFFALNTSYSPIGLAVKDGTLISASKSSYPFFAVTDEGKIIIDEGSKYNDYVNDGFNFVHGVSGNKLVLKDGLLTEGAYETGQGPHPRTAVGITEDGMIILGAVDGRQLLHSNGTGYGRLAIWMRSLGAEIALNLDGGGSTSLVLRNPESNNYAVRNSPSDGELRKIFNSLLVELK